MTRDSIINLIANDTEYKSICMKIAKSKIDAEELYSELILMLLELEPTKIENIYSASNGVLFKFYVIRCAVNMHRSIHSRYGKHYNKNKHMLSLSTIEIDIPDERESINKDRLHNDVINVMNKIEQSYGNEFPYDVKMMEAFMNYRSIRELSRKTNIPFISCYNSLNRIKKKIQDHVIIEHYFNN